MSEEKILNVYQRLNNVSREITGYIRKEKTIGEGTTRAYKAVLYDHVVAHIRKAIFAAGVDITPNVCDFKAERLQDKHDNYFTRAFMKVELVFANIDQPEDRIYSVAWSMGDDYGDKAPGKAFTYGVKAILLKKFLFESGEDEESYTVQLEMDDPITPEQVGWITGNLEKAALTTEYFMNWFHTKVPNARVDRLQQIPAKYYPLIEHTLKKKLSEKLPNKQ